MNTSKTSASIMQSQRTVLFTGAARSIGAAIAKRLGGPGTAVAVHYHGRKSEAEEVVAELKSLGGDAAAFQADLAMRGSADDLMENVVARWGGLDVVVANAGLPNPGVSIAEGTDEQSATLLSVNALAVYSILRSAAARLAAGGRLINIGSSSTLFPSPERALYSASKAASLVLVRALAVQLADRNITANTVIVGPISDGFLAAAPAHSLKSLAESSPFKRMGTADEIADVVGFLASPASRWITGQELLVNGGALV